jgi:hypothetical protein
MRKTAGALFLALSLPVAAIERFADLQVDKRLHQDQARSHVRQARLAASPDPVLKMDMQLRLRHGGFAAPAEVVPQVVAGEGEQEEAATPSRWPIDFSMNVVLAPEQDTARRSSPYHVPSSVTRVPESKGRGDIELRLRAGGLNAQYTVRQQTSNVDSSQLSGIANQIYYDSDLHDGFGWTVGRKVMSWGVGFGFKPLDVIQRENRRGVNQAALVGVPLLAVQKMTADSSWTLAWTHPGAGDGTAGDKDSGVSLHWFQLAGGNDHYAVIRLSPLHQVETGVGATWILDDEISIYGAGLYERRYEKTLNALSENGGLFAGADPMLVRSSRNGGRAVAGIQWTGASGWSLLAEAWYDSHAYSKKEWQDLNELTTRQLAAAALAPAAALAANVAWSSQAFLPSNLLRENLLTRLSWDSRNGFKPYAEWLLTPRDGGQVLTLGALLEGDKQTLSIGMRQLGGPANSVYHLAPLQRMLWAEWRLAAF